MSDIKVGDVVILKSADHLKMTVEAILDNGEVMCVYQNPKTGKFDKDTFIIETLEEYKGILG